MKTKIKLLLAIILLCTPLELYSAWNNYYNQVPVWIVSSTSPEIWLGTGGAGAKKYSNSMWQSYTTSNSGLISNNVMDIGIEKTGNNTEVLWFATANGVSRFDGNNWSSYTIANSGLINNTIYTVLVDHLGENFLAHILV